MKICFRPIASTFQSKSFFQNENHYVIKQKMFAKDTKYRLESLIQLPHTIYRSKEIINQRIDAR